MRIDRNKAKSIVSSIIKGDIDSARSTLKESLQETTEARIKHREKQLNGSK
jgi:thiamine pyrophosphokinase